MAIYHQGSVKLRANLEHIINLDEIQRTNESFIHSPARKKAKTCIIEF
jgi:hypothetical protein